MREGEGETERGREGERGGESDRERYGSTTNNLINVGFFWLHVV